MRDALALDQGDELADVGLGHHDDAPAERHHREAQHARGVGERGEREVRGAAAERIAHQRQRGHRLEVAAGEHHALRQPGRAAGADEHRQVVLGLGTAPRGLAEPVVELVEADLDPHVELLDHRRVGRVVDQALTVEQLEQRAVLGHLVARVDRAPHRAAAGDAEHARERDGVVRAEDPDLGAGLDAVARERARDAVAEVLYVAVGQRRRPRPGRARRGRATRPCRGSR